MGPLGMSAKQHREYLKLQSKEQREQAKMEQDESRKQQLHEIKLKEAAAKANQGIGHKENLHEFKLKELASPLGKPPRINKQKLGIPTTNPMAGTEMFKQGQHKLQYAQGTEGVRSPTDTVPAMLTPGEAVIPAPAAQNPKNKKAIQRMVQEGRNKNALRDGAVDVRYSDAPGQAKYHSNGTTQVVPSLAYEHPDVPGSSFSNGTMSVPDFSRGSSAQQNYSNGTYGVVPPQVQSAAGYFDGTQFATTVDVPAVNPIIDEEKYRELYGDTGANSLGVSLEVPQVDYPSVQVADSSMLPSKNYIANTTNPIALAEKGASITGRDFTPTPFISPSEMGPAFVPPKTGRRWVEPKLGKELPSTLAQVAGQEERAVVPVAPPMTVAQERQRQSPAVVLEVPKPTDVAASTKPVVPAGTSQSTKVVVPLPDNSQSTSASVGNIPYASSEDNAALDIPAKVNPENVTDPYAGLEPTLRKDYEEKATIASNGLRDSESRIREFMKMQGYDVDKPKDTKGFMDSFKDALSYSGAKEILGLNNQDLARMAIMTIGGRMRGANFGRSLAFAGRNMFEESMKRNSQESADKKAAMRNAVTMLGQEKSTDRSLEAQKARDQMYYTRLDEHRKDLERSQNAIAERQSNNQFATEFRGVQDKFATALSGAQPAHKSTLTKLLNSRLSEAGDNNNKQLSAYREAVMVAAYLNDPRANKGDGDGVNKALKLARENLTFANDIGKNVGNNIMSAFGKEKVPNNTIAYSSLGDELASVATTEMGMDLTNPHVQGRFKAIANHVSDQIVSAKKRGEDVRSVAPFVNASLIMTDPKARLSANEFKIGKEAMTPKQIIELGNQVQSKFKLDNKQLPQKLGDLNDLYHKDPKNKDKYGDFPVWVRATQLK